VDLQVNTNVSKDHIVSIFRAEDGSSTSFRNFGIYLQLHKTSQLGTTQKTYYYAVIDWLTDYVGRDRRFRTAAIIGLLFIPRVKASVGAMVMMMLAGDNS
jgi:hypothetical protein